MKKKPINLISLLTSSTLLSSVYPTIPYAYMETAQSHDVYSLEEKRSKRGIDVNHTVSSA